MDTYTQVRWAIRTHVSTQTTPSHHNRWPLQAGSVNSSSSITVTIATAISMIRVSMIHISMIRCLPYRLQSLPAGIMQRHSRYQRFSFNFGDFNSLPMLYAGS